MSDMRRINTENDANLEVEHCATSAMAGIGTNDCCMCRHTYNCCIGFS